MDERRNYLLAVVDNLLTEHEAWSDDDAPGLSADLEARITETCDQFADGDIPGDCRKLDRLVDKLREQWMAFDSRRGLVRETTDLIPDGAFWSVLEEIRKARAKATEVTYAPLETLAQLDAQKVSDRQICIIYGWAKSAQDSPEVWRKALQTLAEERAEPGRHLGREVFVHPMERERQARQEQSRQIAERIREATARRLKEANDSPPESWEQLFTEGVSAKQIARMMHVTVDEVFSKAAELGFDAPSVDYEDVRNARAPQEPELPEATERAMRHASRAGNVAQAKPEKPKPGGRKPKATKAAASEEDDDDGPLSLEGEVALYKSQGFSVPEIADAVGQPVETVEALLGAGVE